MEVSYIIPLQNKVYGLGTIGALSYILLFSKINDYENFLKSSMLFVKNFEIDCIGGAESRSIFEKQYASYYPYFNPQLTVALLDDHFIVAIHDDVDVVEEEESDE